jgi:hypothetical protein
LCSPLHCLLALAESPGKVGVNSAAYGWNEPCHEIDRFSLLRVRRGSPKLDTMAQNGCHVVDADEGSSGDDRPQSRFDIKPPCFSATQGGDQRSVRLASLDRFGSPAIKSAPVDQSVPTLPLSNSRDGLVLGSECFEIVGLALNAGECFVRRQLLALVTENADEHFACSLRRQRAVVASGRIGVVRNVDVEPIRLAASRGGDIKHFASRGRRNHRVGGIHSAPLRAKRRRRVRQLDVLCDVSCRERDFMAARY